MWSLLLLVTTLTFTKLPSLFASVSSLCQLWLFLSPALQSCSLPCGKPVTATHSASGPAQVGSVEAASPPRHDSSAGILLQFLLDLLLPHDLP